MKELFSFENGLISVADKKKRIFSIYRYKDNQNIYVNDAGEMVDYVPEHIYFDEPEPYQAFTTREILNEHGEEYGCFGIRSSEGEIIAEEQWYQIGFFQNGLCPVRYKDTDWGCVNERGELVLPYKYWDPPYFNKYGIAYGNEGLIDLEGNVISETEFNCIEHIDEDQRYINIVLLNEEQNKLVEECGSAPGITTDIFDSKTRRYVLKGIPECVLWLWDESDVENEVIIAAGNMVEKYDHVSILEPGFIVCCKDKNKTVFDFYG